MSGALLKVNIAQTVKLGARWLKPGEHQVTRDELAALLADDLVAPPKVEIISAAAGASAEGDEALAGALRERDEALAQAARLETEVEALKAELARARTRSPELPQQDTTRSEVAAETAPKKGAAAKPKG